MGVDPDLALGTSSLTDWEAEVAVQQNRWRSCYEVGALTVWEIQSQISTLVLVALVAVLPIWTVLPIMITWALIATVAYSVGRRKGLPDVLEAEWPISAPSRTEWRRLVGVAALALVKAWLAGLQPFIYARICRRVLLQPVRTWWSQVQRVIVLCAGLTLFGVTTAHHLLRLAALPERRAFRLLLVGPFLNVPYRVLLSALVINMLSELMDGPGLFW
jgi:hypothetical protein